MLKRSALLLVLTLASFVGSGTPVWADEVIDGEIGPGSLYRIVRPTNWNGMLVLYAHGTVPTDQPVAITPDTLMIMDLLSGQGFAVAASSYSENGWVVKDGAQRTHQLLGIFTSKFGRPSRVYIAGGSMGGLITIKLIETYPGQFAGALLACTPGGGLRANLHYGVAVWALFDLFYPGVLPEIDFDDPQVIDVTSQIILPAIAAMTTDPTGALAIASIDQSPVPVAHVPERFEANLT
jgi:pimeloyl-ACP methyl ester carboxylesterase